MLTQNRNHHLQLTYDSVLIKPDLVSDIESRFDDKQCFPYRHCAFSNSDYLPVVSAPMDTIPCEEFIAAVGNRIFACFSHKFQTLEEQVTQVEYGAGAVIGLRTSTEDISALVNAGASHVLLDVANGGNLAVVCKLEELQYLRQEGIELWAGNVASGNTYKALAHLCDYIRVGIGGGSACTTRVNTGIGVGNITAIDECVRERDILTAQRLMFDKDKNHYYVPVWQYLEWSYPPAKIVADGGVRNNGDICKALACGADLVMLGRMFASTQESAAPYRLVHQPDHPLEPTVYDMTTKVYRGMASKEINEEHKPGNSQVSIEGAQGIIQVTGSAEHIVDQIEGNLRSSMSYVNAHNLVEFRKRATLYPVAHSVTQENGAHMR